MASGFAKCKAVTQNLRVRGRSLGQTVTNIKLKLQVIKSPKHLLCFLNCISRVVFENCLKAQAVPTMPVRPPSAPARPPPGMDQDGYDPNKIYVSEHGLQPRKNALLGGHR